MGVTIHTTLMQTTGNVKKTLDHGEKVAGAFKKRADTMGIDFVIKRDSDKSLRVDIKGCETLMFDFKRFKEIWETDTYRGAYGDEWKTFDQSPETDDHYKQWPEQISLWVDDFCKTQYGEGIITHIWVAEIIRAVAGMCKLAKVYDEGDYYHTRNMKDAFEAIGENQKMIDGLVGTFEGLGYKVVKGSDL